MNDLYGDDNVTRCRCAPIPRYKDWLVVSLINQVDSTRASVMFSASYLIAGWILIFVGAARQHLDLPDVARTVQLLEDGEGEEEEKKKKLYLTPNRQMYNASHIRYKIKAIYTHVF